MGGINEEVFKVWIKTTLLEVYQTFLILQRSETTPLIMSKA